MNEIENEEDRDIRCDTGWKVGCDGSDIHSDYFFSNSFWKHIDCGLCRPFLCSSPETPGFDSQRLLPLTLFTLLYFHLTTSNTSLFPTKAGWLIVKYMASSRPVLDQFSTSSRTKHGTITTIMSVCTTCTTMPGMSLFITSTQFSHGSSTQLCSHETWDVSYANRWLIR